MSPNLPAIAILLCSFFGLMLLRVPIAFSLGMSSVFTVWYLGLPLIIVFQKMVTGLQSFTFLAVPFFILVGLIMSEGGISTKIIDLSNLLIGRVRGGLALVNVLASTFFGGISGSSVADVSSIGSMLIPMMKEKGYDSDYSVAVTVTSSVQGVIIPPSQNMIYYSLAAGGLSVGSLFMAGYIPGVCLGLALGVVTWKIARDRNYPFSEPVPRGRRFRVVLDALIGLTTVVVIIGGIIGGVFTATEAAAVATVYVFAISLFYYRSLAAAGMWNLLKSAIGMLSVILAIIGTSSAFGWLLAYLKVPLLVMQAMLSLSENPVVIMLIVNALLLALGMVMDMGILILLVTPLLIPVVDKIGMSRIQFGIVLLLNLGIGLCTPPVGTSLFIGCAIARIRIEESIRALLPFYAAMFVVVLLATYWPAFSLWLPSVVL
ncbi:MAG: TRAP transporter large permease [Planctomycetota bacterium]|jgi:tripartite ATP-independent transporter DctM subunit|nr:TRAP transporter large permease [Planctomycetota bacterium]